MLEIWKDIQGYEGLYQVSNLGNVLSLNYNKTQRPKKLRLCLNSKGYVSVVLYKNKRTSSCKVHRLVANHFIINLEQKPYINHKDGDRANNHYANLEWVTAKENDHHAVHILGKRKGRKGSQNGAVILKMEHVQQIRMLYNTDAYSQSQLAAQYGVAQTTISAIVRRLIWMDC